MNSAATASYPVALEDRFTRALRCWSTRPAMALLRAIEASRYPSAMPGGPTTLDIGCGNGKFAEVLQLHGAIGVDIACDDLARARLSAAYSRVVVADAQDDLPFEPETFDYVICNSTLEHIERDEDVIGSVSRILAPAGRFLLTVPGPAKESTLYFGAPRSGVTPAQAAAYRQWFTNHWQHFHYRSVQEWARVFEAADLEIVSVVPYESPMAGRIGDLLGYVSIAFQDIPVVGSSDAPQELFHQMMDQLLRPIWKDDAAQSNADPACSGGFFIEAIRSRR